ncbi:kinase-like domain-containing protein [Auriculariales sp. MPI-PUGE-AT-0066]|nr:kinase-like domain-containing protein [Auriculariales sp. MPI-PUGE-AT-0066]
MSTADVHAPSSSMLFFAPRGLASSRPSSPIAGSHFGHGRSQSVPQPAVEYDERGEEEPVRMASEVQRPMSLSYGVSSLGRGMSGESSWKWSSSASSSEDASEESTPSTDDTGPDDPEHPDTDTDDRADSQSPSWSLGYSVIGFSRPRSASPPPITPPSDNKPNALSRPPSPPSIVNDEPQELIDTSFDSSSAPCSHPSSPRARRRDSQKRVSLVAGRLSMISIHPPPSPPLSLSRIDSNLSIISTAPPTPAATLSNSQTGRNIDQFVIDGEAGRGAYGVVKRARERLPEGKFGDPVILKQVVKSRILADCWKKHPRLGTIPIEIYVMSAISHSQYTLPCPRRPWDPKRAFVTGVAPPPRSEGEIVMGHPGICKLIEFWEDAHFYYLVLPDAHPNKGKGKPGDLFDLVELYPNGLPPHLARSYLGQLADATAYLHHKGIVHRDIKDENVVLGEPDGACVLIDFGSSGVVRRAGWDTFNGTLDYAAPEILEGSRYMGKEQDVWAFGVVAYVLLVGECPFGSKGEAHAGLGAAPPFASPSPQPEGDDVTFFDDDDAGRALAARCSGVDTDTGLERSYLGLEPDSGGAFGDAAGLVRACLQVDPAMRPTFEDVMRSKFLAGRDGWTEWVPGWPHRGDALGLQTDTSMLNVNGAGADAAAPSSPSAFSP